MADTPPFDLCAYEPPVSLWGLVERYVHLHEREEIKTVLGASLVEQSLELHDEVSEELLLAKEELSFFEDQHPMDLNANHLSCLLR